MKYKLLLRFLDHHWPDTAPDALEAGPKNALCLSHWGKESGAEGPKGERAPVSVIDACSFIIRGHEAKYWCETHYPELLFKIIRERLQNDARRIEKLRNVGISTALSTAANCLKSGRRFRK